MVYKYFIHLICNGVHHKRLHFNRKLFCLPGKKLESDYLNIIHGERQFVFLTGSGCEHSLLMRNCLRLKSKYKKDFLKFSSGIKIIKTFIILYTR